MIRPPPRADSTPSLERRTQCGNVWRPGTGAYSGTAAAWLLGMDRWKGFWAVTLGVVGMFVIVWGAAEVVAAGIRLF
jgi:hypothetical protein